MNPETSELVIEFAKTLINAMLSITPDWQRAFFRFEVSENHYGSNGSYTTSNAVRLFDPFKYEEIFDSANKIGNKLRQLTPKDGQQFCVCLLVVDSEFNYEVKYEYQDRYKWQISKLDGGSGIPVGL
ncbi:hypothetical protein [Pseudomonas sp. 1928-m]|uniref:hypothetical protein n=1 Tax=Pseudomonas sp. 1928-m TaxID=3033804 RepID=UPI0023DFE946|nr:hypothetical protein [Pseudomonas sp. 1928-m]MDF3196601.1 hypothetical protein [Pseudomonas sp. 1928-m]